VVMFYENFERAAEVVERVRRELLENTDTACPVIQNVG